MPKGITVRLPPSHSLDPVSHYGRSSSAAMPSASPKPTLPALKTPQSATPLSATLPSELPRSPLPGWADYIKQEDIKTPITPPTAYTDFLKALSPAVSSPLVTTSTSSSFSDRSSGKTTPTSQPSSAGSNCSCSCDAHKSVSAPITPPSPFLRPSSARTPTALRRLRIPQSPVYSPATDSPKSSAIRSPFSPADWVLDGKTRYFDSPRTACHRPVSVRQVVTRTVTYTRTPVDLEPAPKGKRKRVD